MSSEEEESASFTPHKRKSRKKCVVFGCGSVSGINQNLSFHTFPKKNQDFVKIKNYFGHEERVDRLTAWLNALKFGKKVTKHMVVCCKHFKPEDYNLPGN